MYDQLRRDPGLPVPNPTRSFWQQPGHDKLLGIKSKELPSRRNIVIIGSGMTACSVSKELLASDLSGTVTVLEAREVCSGATGRNGGRITCIAVRDFDKYRRLYGDEDAKKIVRFELGHYDEMAAAAQELGPELFRKTEVRQDETVATVFSDHKLQEFRDMHANFEAAFPDLAGRIKMLGNEIQEVGQSVSQSSPAETYVPRLMIRWDMCM
jgi:glycine/D-amino acid oxidase-like deaminating enzyme